MIPRIVRAFALLGLASGCGPTDAPQLDAIGDPCRTAYDVCLDESSVRSCVDGVWAERECTAICSELGPAYVADGCDRECVCVLADPDGCVPGQTECIDAESVGLCDEQQIVQALVCTDVCAASGLASLGCLVDAEEPANCWCTAEGTPCDGAAPTCVDEITIASCEADVWVFEECADVCGGQGRCDSLQSPAACECQ
jgi:hypothetical protein